MVQVGILNALDLLLIVILFIGIMVGFVRGAVPQIISVASIWLGLLVTLWLYRLFSKWILQGVGFNANSADTMAFLILLIVFFNAIRLIVKSLTTSPERKKKKGAKNPDDPLDEAPRSARDRYVIGPLNAVGGMFMGFVLTTLWVAIILGVFQFSFQVEVSNVPGVGVSGRGMANQLQGSALVPYFNRVLWLLVQSLSFFVLDPSADILERVVDQVTGAAE